MQQAACVRRKKRKKTKCAAPETHHEIHSSPATATTSRCLATKHVPRVSPYSPASIDPKFVEIGLLQLVTVYRLPIRLPAKSALTWPVV